MATREQGAALRTKREPLCPPTRLIPGWDSALAGALVCLTTTVACEPATGPSRTPAGAVASVEITPPSASVPAGQTLQLMAVPKDVNGTLLSTQTISWSSNNEAAAMVDVGGMVVGVSPGSATISAASSGKSGTSDITVTPALHGGPWPNEPAGFTQIEDQPWGAWGGWGHADPQGSGWPILVTNQNGTLSSPTALEFKYPAGMQGGGSDPGSPGHSWYDIPASRYSKELFVGIWFKVTPNFQGHSSGVQKLYYIGAHSSSNNDLWLEVDGSASGPLGVKLAGEFAGLAPFSIEPNQTNYLPDVHLGEIPLVITRGVWHRYELYVKLPATSGGNGTLRVWVDGVPAMNRTDVPMSFDEQNGWQQVHLDPIWGGVGDTKQHDDYVWFDQTYISGP